MIRDGDKMNISSVFASVVEDIDGGTGHLA
jgi:hypothetical protein